jgi:hypothetical protein
MMASLITVSMTSLSFAHKQKVALTDILYNERTGNLEIAHRISLHDAEHALHEVTESKDDLTKSPTAQAAFAKYVVQRFELTFKDKTKLKLTLVGQEIERGYLWVYQETKIPKPATASFFIANTILQDVIKDQVNTVNIRSGSQVTSLTFKVKSGRKHYAGPADIKQKKEDSNNKATKSEK